MRQSPVYMHKACHAKNRRIIHQLIDLQVDFDPLETAVQVRAEEKLLPKIELTVVVIHCRSDHCAGCTVRVEFWLNCYFE